MAAYRRVHDSRHMQADMPRTGISSGTLLSATDYGLPLPFYVLKHSGNNELRELSGIL